MGENNLGLDVQNVSVNFGAVKALDSVSFEVEQGSIHAVIGPNGAGKSTLFNVLTGIYRASAGTVRYGDGVITDLRPHQVAALGVARTFQNIELSKTTVAQNLLLGRHLQMRSGVLQDALRTRRARDEERSSLRRVEEIAEYLGLGDRLHVRADELPYGDQKRVDLGRALAAEPSLLLLDEPVAGMTRTERKEIADLITRIHADLSLTMLLVEHDMPLVMGLASHCTVIDFGRVIATGSPSEIQSNPAVIGAYLGGASELSTPGSRT